ncbi:unnamed protein product [Closterium sp. Naga37s-1]|nr:unnamed protein product [Closterium sp. Naga37s-1]
MELPDDTSLDWQGRQVLLTRKEGDLSGEKAEGENVEGGERGRGEAEGENVEGEKEKEEETRDNGAEREKEDAKGKEERKFFPQLQAAAPIGAGQLLLRLPLPLLLNASRCSAPSPRLPLPPRLPVSPGGALAACLLLLQQQGEGGEPGGREGGGEAGEESWGAQVVAALLASRTARLLPMLRNDLPSSKLALPFHVLAFPFRFDSPSPTASVVVFGSAEPPGGLAEGSTCVVSKMAKAGGCLGRFTASNRFWMAAMSVSLWPFDARARSTAPPPVASAALTPFSAASFTDVGVALEPASG